MSLMKVCPHKYIDDFCNCNEYYYVDDVLKAVQELKKELCLSNRMTCKITFHKLGKCSNCEVIDEVFGE